MERDFFGGLLLASGASFSPISNRRTPGCLRDFDEGLREAMEDLGAKDENPFRMNCPQTGITN